MRKLYYFILFLTYSTYSYEIKLEGFFLNSSNNSFYINGASFSKKIEIDKKGYFNVNLEIPYIGLYHLNIEKKDIHLYLNKNTHLVINADLLNFIDSIQFKGIGTEENNYWLQKQKLTRNHFDYEKFLKQNKKDSISSEVLHDLKGKYSFITIWTSWCSNCLLEIDHINKLSEQFKNIQFVNISIDATPEKNDWKKVIKTKKYRGIHLLADKQDKSDFIKNFVHDKIQKYILISPEGNLILTDAPSPSDQRLISKFKELGI